MSRRYQGGFISASYNPLKVPNAPTIGTATATGATGAVSVAFTAPSCVGGSAITSYIARSNCGTSATGTSSPITVTGLTNGTAYTFTVIANNSYGPSTKSAASNSATPIYVPPGQVAYTTAGTYTWVAPAGVSKVSVVAVGAGGQGGWYNRGGGGGGLGWKNNISVVPGNSYTVVVAAACGISVNSSYFCSPTLVQGTGGTWGNYGGAGGGYVGDGGGTGGTGGLNNCCVNNGAGGGAGGYSGNGGNGGNYGNAGTAGSGGGGGGGTTCVGGGVGILGQGSNGTAGGGAGSGGSGVLYGGGGTRYASNQGRGAVRIIWPGNTRLFPSTCTGNL